MIIYFIILFLVLLLLSFVSKRNLNLLIFLSASILILFASFRSFNVGTDTQNYITNFENLKYIAKSINDVQTSLEYGYLALERLAYYFSQEYWILLFFIALVSVGFSLYVIKKMSTNIRLSVFLYISLGFYLFLFNGARQSIAAAIFGVSYYYLVKRKLIFFVLWVIIASLFHKTVLIMLPFYFILNNNFTIKKMFYFSILSFIALTFLSKFILIFDDSTTNRYSAYEGRDAQGGLLLTVFFVILSIILINFKKNIKLENINNYNIFLNTCVFSSIIYLVVSVSGSDVNFTRMSLYFSFGYLLIWPLIFRDVKMFNQIATKFIFISIHLVFYGIYLSKMSNLVPFEWNPNLFP
jgi:transmembrane protein EpsG